MAQQTKDTKDLFQQVLHRFTDLPGADSVLHGLNNVRERVDEMQKRLRGLETIERRVTALERKLDALTKDEKKPARKTASKASSGPRATKSASPGSKRTASALKRSGGASRTRRSGNA